MLGEHLEELLGDPVFCQDILPLLPAHVKACLLAVARLRSLLCDAALALLADREQAVLDLHGCGDRLSDVGIRAALRRMPHLRHVRGAQRWGATLPKLGGKRGMLHACNSPCSTSGLATSSLPRSAT